MKCQIVIDWNDSRPNGIEHLKGYTIPQEENLKLRIIHKGKEKIGITISESSIGSTFAYYNSWKNWYIEIEDSDECPHYQDIDAWAYYEEPKEIK